MVMAVKGRWYMKKTVTIILCSMIAFLWTTQNTVKAQDFKFPQVPGFKVVYNYPVYTPGDLWDYINGAADAYVSYGFAELYIAEYVKGRNIIKVEVYDHLTPIRGFGIYSLERSPSYNFITIGAQGYFENGLIHFFKGRYYVKVVTNSSARRIMKSVETIARRVAETLPGDIEMPSVIGSLPAEGKLPNEEVYINESVLGHIFLKGGVKAPYEVDDESFNLYYFEYESTSDAAEAVSAYLRVADIERDSDSSGKYQFMDGYNGLVYLVWNQSSVAVITGLDRGMEEFVAGFLSRMPAFKDPGLMEFQ
jgi:hypothetical protein